MAQWGKAEQQLVEKYTQKAEEVENAGYHRLAIALRKLVKEYEQLAKKYEEYQAEMRML